MKTDAVSPLSRTKAGDWMNEEVKYAVYCCSMGKFGLLYNTDLQIGPLARNGFMLRPKIWVSRRQPGREYLRFLAVYFLLKTQNVAAGCASSWVVCQGLDQSTLDLFFIFCVWGFVCMSTMCMPDVYKSQKRTLNPPELELWLWTIMSVQGTKYGT